jgi:hypothetical protein
MAKFWNFVLFQLGWFACVWGAANQKVLWAVIATFAYIAFHIWRADSPRLEAALVIKVLIYGVSADTLIMYLDLLQFKDSWPGSYLSPAWMWALWALVASTINGSLSWLRGRPVLGVVLGSVCGPMSYEAGIRMGAGAWGPRGQVMGVLLIAVIWGVAMPLFFYWDRKPLGEVSMKNPK